MDTKILMWLAFYVTWATILFNSLKGIFKLNLSSTIILSISVSFLITTGMFNERFVDWFAYYAWALIILAHLITMIYLVGRKTPNSKAGTTLKEKGHE